MEDTEWRVSIEHQMIGLLYAIVAILGIIFNFVTFQTFFKERRRSFFHIQLSIANIAGLAAVVFSGPSALHGRWYFSHPYCRLYGFLSEFCNYAQILLTCSVCLESYLIACHRNKYDNISNGMFAGFSAFLWLYSLGFAIAPMLGWNSYVRERWGTSCGFDLGRFHSSNSSYLSATLSLNTVFVVFTIYCLVQAYRNSRRGHNEFEPLLNDVELVKICIAMLVIAIVCRLPYTFRVLESFRRIPRPTISTFTTVELTHISVKLSNMLQPLSYVIFSTYFKELATCRITGVEPGKKNI